MLKNGRKIVLIIAALTLLSVFAGCSTDGDDNQKTEEVQNPIDRSTILIGIAMPDDYERWVKDGETLRDAALELGYMVDLKYAPADQDIQNTQIETFIDNGATLIIVAVINDGIIPFVKKAKDNGVTIIAYDRLITGTGDYDHYISFNNDMVGQMQGQAIVDALDFGSPKNIVLFAGSPDDKNAEYFLDGAMKVLSPYMSSNHLIVVDGKTEFADVGITDWNPANGKPRMDNLFDGSKTIDATLAPNDNVARYIIDGYFSTGNVPIVTGQDGEFDSAKYIKEDKQYMTVFKHSTMLAKKTVTFADQILQGKKINIPGLILATGNLAEIGDTGVKKVKTYLMEPLLITKANLQELIDAEFWFSDEQKEELME